MAPVASDDLAKAGPAQPDGGSHNFDRWGMLVKIRRSITVAATGLGVAATVLFGGGVAQAYAPMYTAWTGSGGSGCEALLYVEPGTSVGQTSSHDYAQAGVYQSVYLGNGDYCKGWLERSTDGVNFNMLGDYHETSGPGGSNSGGWYYDGPGYWNRACAIDMYTAHTNCTTAY